jgi:hypothetical protein
MQYNYKNMNRLTQVQAPAGAVGVRRNVSKSACAASIRVRASTSVAGMTSTVICLSSLSFLRPIASITGASMRHIYMFFFICPCSILFYYLLLLPADGLVQIELSHFLEEEER